MEVPGSTLLYWLLCDFRRRSYLEHRPTSRINFLVVKVSNAARNLDVDAYLDTPEWICIQAYEYDSSQWFSGSFHDYLKLNQWRPRCID